MKNKGESEVISYLLTYGWAILIIIVVVGALFVMGVFHTKNQSDIEHKLTCEYVCEKLNYAYNNDYFTDDCVCMSKEGCVEVLNNVTGNTDLYCKETKTITIKKVCCD